MRRPPATLAFCALLLPVAMSAAGCGGGAEAKQKPPAALKDAPKASEPASRKVAVVVDRKRTEVDTTGATVLQVLEQAGVKLGRYDLVVPPRDAPAGDTITVTRLLSRPVVTTVQVPAPTIKKKDAKLPPFTQKVLRPGKPGITVVRTALVLRKGKKVKAVLEREVKSRPVPRVLALGPTSGGGPASGLNWAGLAKCESGGNPRAVNPAGYYGLYQFSLASWASVGGSGKPSDAPAAEQTYRAQLLYKKVGGRWQGQWPNCGRFLFG
ncbi:transglycosylase family protein [Actinomadura macrotermitis]|uniref:G5 domain-containing protein n=1 Tax=Actinomadura macrotermitis TaxID=2585200 RepID=A0A7K0BS60_9ACTN|nr:hypothetical protein [Actinomadura macrotermitis]